MTGTSNLVEPNQKPRPPVFTSDAVVRDALARYLDVVARRLRDAGHRVGGPILAPPEQRLAGTLTLPSPSPSPSGTAAAVGLVAEWNEETGWSTRREPPDQARPGGERGYLHLGLVPAPVIAAQFITDTLTVSDGGSGGADRAAPTHPAQFRYRTGRGEHLLGRLTRAT
jgi:hypothetical protein